MGMAKARPLVLIVDDNPKNLQVLGSVLDAEGYELAFMGDGTGVCEFVCNHPVAVILLDVMMPGLDGFETCRLLKADARTREVPVIFLTAMSDQAEILRGFEAGAVDYVTKPFNAHELRMRVRTHVDLRLAHERLMRKNREMTHLFHSVSHDLRSPLMTIHGFSEEIKSDLEQDDAPAILQSVSYIQASAARIKAMLDSMLEVAKAGDSRLEFASLDLAELVAEVSILLGDMLKKHGVHLVAPASPTPLVADHGRMVQLLQNLVENAVKYMGEQPKPVVEIGCDTAGNQPVYFVRDNGSGIDAGLLELIFDAFRRGKGHVQEGSGIGLSLVQRIVEAHKGQVWAESGGPGRGATFRFTLGAGE